MYTLKTYTPTWGQIPSMQTGVCNDKTDASPTTHTCISWVISSFCMLRSCVGSCWSLGLFLSNDSFGQAGSHTATVTALRWGVPAACAHQSNETFSAISANKLTASLTGGPLGDLVRMLSYNCTICWQGGTWRERANRTHFRMLWLSRQYFWSLLWLVNHVTICVLSCYGHFIFLIHWRRSPLIQMNNRLLLFLGVVAHIKLWNSHGTNDWLL